MTKYPTASEKDLEIAFLGQPQPHFVYFRSFHNANKILTIGIWSVDCVLGTWTRSSRIEGADESTELWWHPNLEIISIRLQTSS